MAGRQAKVLTPHNVRRMLAYVGRTATPERDRVVILLAVKSGLRAAEIAKLTWPMVLDSRGRVSTQIELVDEAAKKRTGRRVPMHPELRVALSALRRKTGAVGPVVRSARGDHLRPNSLVNWFRAMLPSLACRAARRTPAGAPSSPTPPVLSTRPVAASVTSNYSPGTARSRRRSATSTATPTPSAGSST